MTPFLFLQYGAALAVSLLFCGIAVLLLISAIGYAKRS